MARFARVVIPGIAHHVTQRGNRRQRVFFCEEDYRLYLRLLAEWSEHFGLAILAYCLMPNHVHLIGVPEKEMSLADAVSETHRRYTYHINRRELWGGNLWQGRFASFPLDGPYLYNAIRYVENNPPRAMLVQCPEEWEWSSAAEGGKSSAGIVHRALRARMFGDTPSSVQGGEDDFRKHQRTGRPLGGGGFIEKLERISGKTLHKRKPGPKKVKTSEV